MGFEWIVPIFEAVLGSVVRSALMLLTGYLIKRHLVSEEIAARFVSDGVEHVLIAAPALLALGWSVWAKVKGRVKLLTALQSQPGTTERQLEAKVENGMGVSLKAGAVLLACVLGGAAALSMPACASAPPAGTYSTAGLKAFNADQLLKDVTALSETAVNLNATAGPLHLKDRDTALIRDFALSAGAGLVAYADGKASLGVVVAAFEELSRKLSAEATLNDQLRFVLALVAENIHRIPGQ